MTLNASTVSAGTALETLRAGWAAQAAGKMTTSWMLHGAPGVGKTQVVGQLAKEIGARLFDLRLTTIEPQDLRGLPYYDHATQKTIWYRPEDLPDDPETPAILFLDELTAAPPMLQPTVYGLLQERRVGTHRLPDSVMVIAAGNSADDGAVAYEMGTALSDRLIHLRVVAAASDWLENYAVPRALHPAVIAFIRSRGDLLDTGETALAKGDIIAATPRSWEKVSQILHTKPDRRLRDVLVAGTVGSAAAAEFALVADEVAASIRIDDLLSADAKSRVALYPAGLNALYGLVYGLVGAFNAERARSVIDLMAEIGRLADLRPEPEFQRLPLAELRTHGFELLIARGLGLGLEDAFLDSPAYTTYAAEREAAGVA
ncbi:AAA family ATPase [Tropicimonas sp. S265A]|uniref:AAA family ATPase n=1 Tax=Tropicimonas sp. S265A TaxID=3415134 RepID=UPI003C7C5A0E